MVRRKVLIMGAAGRDFHDFNTHYRDDPDVEVVAFTATQIPNIEGRKYPAALSGPHHPGGIPIHPEEELVDLIVEKGVDEVVFAYSDVSHGTVMHKASTVLAAGASFTLLGPKDTEVASTKPVIGVCAVRTGCGKSPVSRYVRRHFQERGLKVAVIRHPMPYGDLEKQAVQRFASHEDLDLHECTIEEREEYEPHLREGAVVFAGVDYEAILRAAEKEADLILWDGGNNDQPFYTTDLLLVVTDPHRAGHELLYHPGEANLRMADAVIVSKTESARPDDVRTVEANIRAANPGAPVLHGALAITVSDPAALKGKRALVVEDGPTVTHGGMAYGAGSLAAQEHGAILVDGAKFAQGSIVDVYRKYPHLDHILPAMGYGAAQVADLEATINASDADIILDGTPVDLSRLIHVNKPVAEVDYHYEDKDGALEALLSDFAERFL